MNFLIIGAGGRIGFSLITHLLKEGHTLALGDIDLSFIHNNTEFLETYESQIFLKEVDITSDKSYKSWIVDACSALGSVDGAVNCSYPKGKNYGATLSEVDLSDFNNNISIHLGAYFNFLQITSAFMQDKNFNGSILCTSSIYGDIAPRFNVYQGTNMTMPVEYAAIKSAINQLIKYFAAAYSGAHIRFNAVSPGGILADQPDSFIAAYKDECLSKGLLDSEDISPLISFLLSDGAQFINGQVITIDDGFSL
ncbi:oxidoreductase [Gammaproteobacteria bacterium]|jgi:NAD(P)-dependent dehydrogenase (short-subunit alcohol dehydrogenase family)|nr:oxidoreductase [Gammaproteobacteria bacterium]